jgi:hypothetical protein
VRKPSGQRWKSVGNLPSWLADKFSTSTLLPGRTGVSWTLPILLSPPLSLPSFLKGILVSIAKGLTHPAGFWILSGKCLL